MEINRRNNKLKEERAEAKKSEYTQNLQRQMEKLEERGLKRQQRNEVKQIMRVAASELRELEEEDIKNRQQMSEIKKVYYHSLELKREAPTTTRPAAY